MPIYEFQCQSCGNQVEVLQKMSDDPLTVCDSCGKPDMKKLVSAAAFRLSGSGWYETDFKPGNKKNLKDDGTQKDNNKSSTEKDKTKDTKKDKTAAKFASDKKTTNKA